MAAPGADGVRARRQARPAEQDGQGTCREAGTGLAKFVAEVDAKSVAASGAITFGCYVTEQCLPQVKDNLSPETYRNQASRANGRIIPTLFGSPGAPPSAARAPNGAPVGAILAGLPR